MPQAPLPAGVCPSLLPSEALTALAACVQSPAGFTFSAAELTNWCSQPRVVHNSWLIEFAEAQVLATRSHLLRSATYPVVVLQVTVTGGNHRERGETGCLGTFVHVVRACVRVMKL